MKKELGKISFIMSAAPLVPHPKTPLLKKKGSYRVSARMCRQ